MVNKGIQPNAVTLKNPDFAAIARAYACGYAKPQKLGEIEPAIAAALAADRPTIIEMTPRLLQGEALGNRQCAVLFPTACLLPTVRGTIAPSAAMAVRRFGERIELILRDRHHR